MATGEVLQLYLRKGVTEIPVTFPESPFSRSGVECVVKSNTQGGVLLAEPWVLPELEWRGKSARFAGTGGRGSKISPLVQFLKQFFRFGPEVPGNADQQ